MSEIKIETIHDPRLDVYARLTEAQLRNKLEPEKGIFIAESFKVIERAVEGRMIPVSFLTTEEWLEQTRELVRRCETAGLLPDGDVPVYIGEVSEIKKLTGYEVTRGMLCAMRRPQLPSVEELLTSVNNGEGAKRIAVLEGIVDHTNVGALFRSAAALSVDAVLVTPTCCDPLYRRAVRVSMGTVFQVPWTRIGETVHDWPQAGLEELHRLGFVTAALALSDNSVSLDEPVLKTYDKLALIFGTEGDGLSHKTIQGCTHTVKIPMAHNVDSLNVAAASAVTFWELCR